MLRARIGNNFNFFLFLLTFEENYLNRVEREKEEREKKGRRDQQEEKASREATKHQKRQRKCCSMQKRAKGLPKSKVRHFQEEAVSRSKRGF